MVALPPWFSLFCDPSQDRLAVLAKVLHSASVPFELLKTGRFRHVQVRAGLPEIPVAGEKVVIAHFDRVPGVPGANDNGASVLSLVNYLRQNRPGPRLRVIFTDGEELVAGASARDQGAFALGTFWGPNLALVPVVLDMTGIGDTLVLGHLGEHLMRRHQNDLRPTDLDRYARLRLSARRWLATCGAGDTLEINTPFSDDLGLFLAGIPSIQVSVLPRKQALLYRRVRSAPGELEGRDAGELPAAWRTMHTADDRPENLTPSALELVAQTLAQLERFPFG